MVDFEQSQSYYLCGFGKNAVSTVSLRNGLRIRYDHVVMNNADGFIRKNSAIQNIANNILNRLRRYGLLHEIGDGKYYFR